MKFSTDCDLDKELSTTLLDLYQKNTELEFRDHKITRRGILEHIFLSKKKSVTFDLPPIEEDTAETLIYGTSLRKYAHPKLHLMDPQCPDN